MQFEQLEVAPQALESLFAAACGLAFTPSFDNLDGVTGDAARFARSIGVRRQGYLRQGLPECAHTFHCALRDFYHERTRDLAVQSNVTGQVL